MTMHDPIAQPSAAGRWQTLKVLTAGTHETLDKRIMAARPFENQERYALFLVIQHRFHQAIDTYYDDATLNALIEDLSRRKRLDLIAQDLADLGKMLPSPSEPADAVDPAEKLGWIYVAEGSNLGAAFLLKAAAAIGLNAAHGARHLAAHPDGRGKHWRSFTTVLDSLAFSPEQDDLVCQGAVKAFQYVHRLTDETYDAMAG
ncbi:biliverdin-producing heme oxygenase [Limoniibacter endophyticus]|nr:biliverdin-producing heme oxygenase [Limoniibacter endophyticus]